MALKSNESNVRSSKLKANYLKWYDGILSPAYSDRHQSLDVRLRHEAALMDEAMVEPRCRRVALGEAMSRSEASDGPQPECLSV